MSDLGKHWAGTPTISANPLKNKPESGVFHRIDIAGVASSILATPTIQEPRKSIDFWGFLLGHPGLWLLLSCMTLDAPPVLVRRRALGARSLKVAGMSAKFVKSSVRLLTFAQAFDALPLTWQLAEARACAGSLRLRPAATC